MFHLDRWLSQSWEGAGGCVPGVRLTLRQTRSPSQVILGGTYPSFKDPQAGHLTRIWNMTFRSAQKTGSLPGVPACHPSLPGNTPLLPERRSSPTWREGGRLADREQRGACESRGLKTGRAPDAESLRPTPLHVPFQYPCSAASRKHARVHSTRVGSREINSEGASSCRFSSDGLASTYAIQSAHLLAIVGGKLRGFIS